MKFLFFLPIILFFAVFAVLIIGFLSLVFKLIMKTKQSSWKGVVVDKKYVVRDDPNSDTNRQEELFSLVVKTDDDKTMKLGVSRKLYEECNIGDKMKKEKGKLLPEKV